MTNGFTCVKKVFRYKLRPSKLHRERLDNSLNLCRRLYNGCLEHRRMLYRGWNAPVSKYDQIKQLPELKAEFTEYRNVYSQVLQNVVDRADKTFQAFFRRVKHGEKPGYPRFKGANRYHSICYPQSGFRIEGNHVVISKIGTVKMVHHREIPRSANIKSMTLKRDMVGDWFVSFMVELPDLDLPRKPGVVGIDLGIRKLATLSDGTYYENPRWLSRTEHEIKHAQRMVARKTKGSNNRRKAVVKLAKKYRKLKRQRLDYLHKVSRQLADRFGTIAFEDLTIKNMLKNHRLAKHIADGSWDKLIQLTTYKAEEAGGCVVTVDPRNTSQECSGCGKLVRKSLVVVTHRCRHCGRVVDRDLNAAYNILSRALKSIGQGMPEFTPAETGAAARSGLTVCVV